MSVRGVPPEVIRAVRRIEIRTRRIVQDSMAGEYHSVFRGRGMEFSEVREYQVGDDVRSIDWNVSARMGHPFVKKYVEERELTVFIAVDVSGSKDFGSRGRTKAELAAEVAALLAFSAIKNNDRVGAILFTGQVEKYIPPKKGKTHVLRVIREILSYEPVDRRTDVGAALEYARRVLTRHCVLFLISDFLASGYDKPLRIAARKYDMIAISIEDPREASFPDVGLLEIEDAETGARRVVDTGDPRLEGALTLSAAERRASLKKSLRASGVDLVRLSTGEPYDVPLIRYFEARARSAR
ncbi:MAG: DUF58 domain-containing protein [Acidobacteria bacterium]|nr:DUF58 domain-containing protein [Acidobacteriota bacterium]